MNAPHIYGQWGNVAPDGFKLLRDGDIADSPTIEKVFASGRARCRICGEKIRKGDFAYEFSASFTDGGSHNEWTAVTCFAHVSCCKYEYRGVYDHTKKETAPEAPCPPLCPSDCSSRRACEEEGAAALREEAGQVPPGIGVDVPDAEVLAYQDKPPLDELDPDVSEAEADHSDEPCPCGDPDCSRPFGHPIDLDEADARSIKEDEFYHEAKDEGRLRRSK